ncbi:MAG TPA: DNA recombination/repair protein RecA, partial [bacterium]|nr:DNA recombination/repair protein RecA [bacterium]
IEKKGSYFNYGDKALGQGKEAVIKRLKEEPELAARIEKEIREKAVATRPQKE